MLEEANDEVEGTRLNDGSACDPKSCILVCDDSRLNDGEADNVDEEDEDGASKNEFTLTDRARGEGGCETESE